MILDLFRKNIGLYNIQGYDDIKDIVRRALDAEDNYNLLFIGPPASAKTLFLLGILDMRKNGVYLDGRILDVLEEERPRIICIDQFGLFFGERKLQIIDMNDSDKKSFKEIAEWIRLL